MQDPIEHGPGDAWRAETAPRTGLGRHADATGQQIGPREAVEKDLDPPPCGAMRGLTDDARNTIDGFTTSQGSDGAGSAVARHEAPRALAVGRGFEAAMVAPAPAPIRTTPARRSAPSPAATTPC